MGLFKKKKPQLPELYAEEEIDALEAHIGSHFGKFETVFHEILSPDIHVDITMIEPTKERNYYTLVTMGMGAHRMNVPSELAEYKLERAELMVCLPPDWKVSEDDEKWYWPLRWLKVMARLPGEHNTWLGWGHTVPKGAPFAENTKLCGILLLTPVIFGEDAQRCTMPDGSQVVFYQMVPLYQEEMDFKVSNNAEELLDRMIEFVPDIVDINRPNVCEI